MKLVLFSLAACFLLINCQDPLSAEKGNGDGIITVTIGGTNARTVLPWANALDSSELTHTITISDGPGTAPPPQTILPGETTASFSVAPGTWTISVKAYYSGDLVAEGSETKQINPGNNTVKITMKSVQLEDIYVTYDANGGTFEGGAKTLVQTVKKYNKAPEEPRPTNGRLYFVDWFTEQECTNKYDFRTPVTESFTLYAGWSADSCTVTFVDSYYTTIPSQTVGRGGRVDAPDVTREGYTAEWYKEPEFDTLWDFDEDTVTEDMSLYVKWVSNSVVNASPPVIIVQPVATNEIYLDETVILTVSASPPVNGGTLSYQWYDNGTTNNNSGGSPVGTDSNSYTTSPLTTVGTHHFYCVVTNTNNSVNGTKTATVTSHVATVKVYGVGSGTESDPYIVYNVTTLERVGKGTGQWAGWSLSAYYLQIRDIELPDPVFPEVSNWTPIGGDIYQFDPMEDIGTPDTSFTGSYDGNGKTIGNLKIYDVLSEDFNGLFGCISGSTVVAGNIGVVKNVGIVKCNITGNADVGGVVGRNYGTVENCYVTGDVSGTSNNYAGVGGVVGCNRKEGTVQNCYATGNVSGAANVGGVVGFNAYGTVQNCYATGNVSGTSGGVGGVVGETSSDYGGCVKNCYSTGIVSGQSGVGGVVGFGPLEYCVALNPNIIGNEENTYEYTLYVGRVQGILNQTGGRPEYNIYGRLDMKKNGGEFSGDENGNGIDITSDDWGNASWWTGTALFDEEVWDFSDLDGIKLPKLKNMPGGTAVQNPVVQYLP